MKNSLAITEILVNSHLFVVTVTIIYTDIHTILTQFHGLSHNFISQGALTQLLMTFYIFEVQG